MSCSEKKAPNIECNDNIKSWWEAHPAIEWWNEQAAEDNMQRIYNVCRGVKSSLEFTIHDIVDCWNREVNNQ